MVERRRAWLLIPISGTLLIAGGAWLLFTPAQEREVVRVAELPVVRPADFPRTADGQSLLLEGKLRAREPMSHPGFLVYSEQYLLRRETEGANQGRERWGDHAVSHPTLTVEGEGYTVETCDGDYRLVQPPHSWQSEVVPRSGDLFHEATIRRFGFRAGDVVTLEGVARPAAGKACLAAEVLFGGTRPAYLDHQRTGVVALRVVGGVFCGLGALMLGIGWIMRPRRSS